MNKAINKKVVITGGPGTGKTSVIKKLMDKVINVMMKGQEV